MKSNLPVTKGMIFAGCSFTWGQGLYYYSNLPTLQEPKPCCYDADIVRYTHYEYTKTKRFARLVANHFNTFEVCQPFNGGATYSIADWWNQCFSNVNERDKSLNGDWLYPKYDYSDFSHIIYQFTQWTRSRSPAMIVPNSDGAIVQNCHINCMQHEDFDKWLIDNNMTPEEYVVKGLQQDIEDVKKFLRKFEDNGVKAYVLSWPFDIVPYILKDPWLSERFITFKYKNIEYTNMEHMMGFQHQKVTEVLHPELTINRDIENFEFPPYDWHPSLTCHRVVADTIINHIEKNEST